MTEPKSDRSTDRAARAQEFFEAEHNLAGQQDWYERRATHNKKCHTRLGFVILAAGAFTTVIQVWVPSPPEAPVHWTTWLTALLGATVLLAKGAERIWSYDDNWRGYRIAAESMKTEQRLYVNAAGPYARIDDEASAYRLFVERIESVIAVEQQNFAERNAPTAADSAAAANPAGS